MSTEYEYDVALSFAGEDRGIVEEVARILVDRGLSIFYDRYEEIDLWGKDLSEYLDQVYRMKARYCVVFISKNYAEKAWSRQERRSAFARALEEKSEYILPYRLDETEIPGIRPTVAYLDIARYPPIQLAEAIIKKCGVGVSSWLEREFDKPMIINKMPPLHSLHIFSERMRQALPGERDLVEICSSETIRDLLDTVLKWPLTFVERNGERGYVPIWWWRGGFQRSIIRYEYVDDYGHFLINEHELDIAKLVAHRTRAAEDMEFIYVETRAVDPSGIYTLTDSDFAEMVARFGFASEELGYYNGRYINIAELDDGYTRINGEVVPVTGEAEVRRRYLTPYNLLIAPKASRINNSSIDRRIQALLNGILTGVSTLQDIVDLLYERPRKNY